MSERVMLVVGDKFAQFAVGKDVITLSQLCGLLGLPAGMMPSTQRVVLMPGQGLGDDDIEMVLTQAGRSAHADRFDLTVWRQAPKRAHGDRSHKRDARNTLISEPRRLEEDVFELDLLVDEDCELMSDHQTGQHLQGMLLLEAARQSFLAVTEAFFLPQDGTKFYFVINEMSVTYNAFAFPLDARIRYLIREMDIASPHRQRFVADIVVVQCGVTAASFRTSFTVFEDGRIASKEGVLAQEAFNSHMASLRQEQSAPAPEWVQ
jgi:hypothetical protein